MEPNQINPSSAPSWIPQGIPTWVFVSNNQTPAASTPPPVVAPVVPDSAEYKQWPLDRWFHSLIKFMAKVTWQPDPITWVPNPVSHVLEKWENIIGKVRGAANQVVDKAEGVATQAVGTATNVATKAVNTATNVANQAVQQVKQIMPPVVQTPTSGDQTPVQPTPEQPK